MDAYYFEIRNLHIAAALASGGLFLIRALALNLLAAGWPLAKPVRRASYVVDATLLAAALMLMPITRQYPVADAWLTMKVIVLLPAYILLGYQALRAERRAVRLAASAGAASAFLLIYSVARTHSPLGPFAWS